MLKMWGSNILWPMLIIMLLNILENKDLLNIYKCLKPDGKDLLKIIVDRPWCNVKFIKELIMKIFPILSKCKEILLSNKSIELWIKKCIKD